MKTSFSAIALALVASATATKFVVSGDGYMHENGKQILASNGAVEFQSQGSEFTVSDGFLRISNGQKRTYYQLLPYARKYADICQSMLAATATYSMAPRVVTRVSLSRMAS